MKYQLVSTAYDYEGSNDIYVWARDEKGEKQKLTFIGADPYYFVPSGEIVQSPDIISQEPNPYPSVHGEKIDKIITKLPRHVGELRDKYTKHFEADIKFPWRHCIDNKIFSSFEIPDGKTMVPWSRVKPCDFYTEPLVVICDIEVRSKGVRFPKATDKDALITVVCFYDTKNSVYLSIAVDPKGKKEKSYKLSKTHMVYIVPTEKKLLLKTMEYLNYIDPDIFVAWYVDFDKDFIDTRANLTYKLGLNWDSMDTFDICAAYKVLYSFGSGKLIDVVQKEKLPVPNYETFKQEYWTDDLERAILVNKSHVEACVILDRQKNNIIRFFHNLKILSGLSSMGDTLYHGKLIEGLKLRRYNGKFAVPSKPSKDEISRRKQRKSEKVGGKVFDPPFGIFEDVGVLDMTRYYPELLVSLNLSTEPHEDMGIVPQLTLDLIKLRLKYDKMLREFTPGTDEYTTAKFQRTSVKFITETIVGDLGHEPSRFFDLDDYNKVTKTGQKGLVFLQGICKRDNHKFMYGDTDSVFLSISKYKSHSYVDVLNEELKIFGKQEGITRELSLKVDYHFKKIIFKKIRVKVGGRWIERGVKKKYAGIVDEENSKDVNYLKIVGFEYVRRDTSIETKKLQPTIIDLILSDKETPEIKKEVSTLIKSEVSRIKSGITSGEIPVENIVIPKTLSKNPSEYGREKDGIRIAIPDYARGALYCNEWFSSDIHAGDQVKMVYVNNVKGYPKTDVISYLSYEDIPVQIEVNIEKMIDRCIKGTISGLIELIGLNWNEIFHPHKSLFDQE